MNPTDAPKEDSAAQPDSRVEDALTGLVVIAIGLVFLAGNFGIQLPFVMFENWWALFILAAAVPSAGKAFRRYRSIGGFDAKVVHWALTALSTVAVGLIFLLHVSFGVWWPVFVIIGGLYMLVPGRRRRDRLGRDG